MAEGKTFSAAAGGALATAATDIRKAYIHAPADDAMGHVLEITDFTGRPVLLTQEQWTHIQRKHPEVSLQAIEEVVTRPTKVSTSDRDHSVLWLFRYWKAQREHLLVAVKYLSGKGFIITAFHTKRTT